MERYSALPVLSSARARYNAVAMERRAFSLLETLIALTILGIAIFSMVGWLVRSVSFEGRLEHHRLALRELEAQAESMRAGMPLPGLDGSYVVAPITDLSRLEAPVVRLTVAPTGQAGLYSVQFVARYRIRGQPFERKLDSLTWRP